MPPTSEEIVKNAEEILKNEDPNFDKEDMDNEQILNEFILPGLKNSKDTLSSIYDFRSRNRAGFLGRLKSMLQNKIINTVINVMEKPAMKQQKFNELTYKAIEALIKENEELKKKLQS